MKREQSEWLLRVEGVVQGVGFRSMVAKRAEEYRIKGYVENRLDGSVEICAQGDEMDLEAFVRAVRTRPGLGSIERLQIDRRSLQKAMDSFEIRM